MKPWWASRGVWGGIVSVLAGLAGIWGVVISPEDKELLVVLLVSLSSTLGGVVSVIGRVKAKTKIGASK